MRTTLTLDPDVAHQLQEKAAQEGATFKSVVNETLRRGLRVVPEKRPGFRVQAFHLGVRPDMLPDRFNQLADELEDEAIVAKIRK